MMVFHTPGATFSHFGFWAKPVSADKKPRIQIKKNNFILYVVRFRNCPNLLLFIYHVVQPFQGWDLIYLIFRGLIPTVIQIKPFQGC
jgi:hypothetical protein